MPLEKRRGTESVLCLSLDSDAADVNVKIGIVSFFFTRTAVVDLEALN